MNNKHTPGPWSWQAQTDGNAYAQFFGRRNRSIFTVRHNGNGKGLTDVQVANLNLIVTAPDLLEALKAALPYVYCVEALEDKDKTASIKAHQRVLALCNRAIANAKGMDL